MSGIQSSGPKTPHVDERKRKRMISNRESARRSRMRKQKQLEDLVNEVNDLKSQSARIRESIDRTFEKYAQMVSSNNVLRSQAVELTERLRYLNAVLRVFEEVGGFDVVIPEVPDLILKPWHQPCPLQPITPSEVDMY